MSNRYQYTEEQPAAHNPGPPGFDPSKEVDMEGMNISSKEDKKEVKKPMQRLRHDAPEFDVKSSPTIDPYGHPLGVSTRPEYVPPAQVLKHANPKHNLYSDKAAPKTSGTSDNVPPGAGGTPQHVRHRGMGHGHPSSGGLHPQSHMGRSHLRNSPGHAGMGMPPNPGPVGMPHPGMRGGQQPHMLHPGHSPPFHPENGHSQGSIESGGRSKSHRDMYYHNEMYASKSGAPLHGNAPGHHYVGSHGSHSGHPMHGQHYPRGYPQSHNPYEKQKMYQYPADDPQWSQKGADPYSDYWRKSQNAPAAQVHSYKPSRNFGVPKPEEVDPAFANPPELRRHQRWELLESAKRWLPGEGTVTTWEGYRYIIGAPIHMGMNGHIHFCYRYPLPGKNNEQIDAKDVKTVAAKVVPNTSAFAREIVFLRALQGCENITKLYDVLESKRTLISILELAQADVYNFFVGRGAIRHGWSLEKPAVREAFARMVISNAVQGLKQMHGKNYLHCDLKSLNILLYIYKTKRKGGVYMKAKLTDFGHSSHGEIRRAEGTFRSGMARVGTAGHVAPELFEEGRACDYKIDIWSLGIVMFSMLVPGRLLFDDYTNLDSLKKSYDKLNKMNPWSRETRPKWWTDFERLSPEARDLILWMTRYDPKDRPTPDQILNHPWFIISRGNLKPGQYRPKLKEVHKLCSSSFAQE